MKPNLRSRNLPQLHRNQRLKPLHPFLLLRLWLPRLPSLPCSSNSTDPVYLNPSNPNPSLVRNRPCHTIPYQLPFPNLSPRTKAPFTPLLHLLFINSLNNQLINSNRLLRLILLPNISPSIKHHFNTSRNIFHIFPSNSNKTRLFTLSINMDWFILIRHNRCRPNNHYSPPPIQPTSEGQIHLLHPLISMRRRRLLAKLKRAHMVHSVSSVPKGSSSKLHIQTHSGATITDTMIGSMNRTMPATL